jgi:predicted dehydrogenase
VFVEKPLGLSFEELDKVWAAGAENDRLAIGFNRPFAELAAALGEEVRALPGPVQLVYRVSAPVAADHWLNDPLQGGGRILGEACHMFDFANWLCGSPQRVHAVGLPSAGASTESADVTIQYADGSVASVHYSGIGPPSMPKERIEVFRGGRGWVLDDFKKLTSFDADGERTRTARGDKGHAALLARVLDACRGKAQFDPGLGAAYLAQSVALGALESIATGDPVPVASPGSAA